MLSLRWRSANRRVGWMLWRFERSRLQKGFRNGACNGTTQEYTFGTLPVRCAAGDLQQLLPGQRGGHFLRRTRRDTSSGSDLQPCGAEPARAIRRDHDGTRRTRRADAAAGRASRSASDGGADWTGMTSDAEALI